MVAGHGSLGGEACHLSSAPDLSFARRLRTAWIFHPQRHLVSFFLQPGNVNRQDARGEPVYDRLFDIAERPFITFSATARVGSDRIVHDQCFAYCRPTGDRQRGEG